ncbi:MAG: YpmS family protein [Paenibacillaceae bacterium]
MSITVRTVFITLFVVIIAVFALSAWLVFLYPSTGHIIISKLENNKNTARFQVTTQKDELEKVINKYLHENVDSDGLSYTVSLDNDLQFHGDVRILGIKVPISIAFEPILQANGDLVLKQQYFQVGALSLPASIVLEYLNRSYTFPEWIVLQPVQKKIYLSTTNMSSDSGVRIHVQKFDLNKDEFKFDVYLPGESH